MQSSYFYILRLARNEVEPSSFLIVDLVLGEAAIKFSPALSQMS